MNILKPSTWFGADKMIDNVFDMEKGLLTQVGGWIGRQNLTPEELIVFNADMTKGVQAYAVATMGENTDRSSARRDIAKEWIRLQIQLIKLVILCVFIDYLILRLDGTEAGLKGSVFDIAFSPYLWGVTGAVSVFFFGSHALRSSKWSKEEK